MKTVVLTLLLIGITTHGWSNDTIIKFDSIEILKIESMINSISPDSIELFEQKYYEWVESTNIPEIQGQSNPEKYKTQKFYEFKDYTLSLGVCYIGLLIDFFEEHSEGVSYYILLDITYDEYSYLIDSAKNELDSLGIVGAVAWKKNITICYFKKILSTIDIHEIPSMSLKIDYHTIINLFPNPVVNHFILEFETKNKESISIQLLNSKGQVVEIIENSKVFNSGKHLIEWNKKDEITAGFYILKIESTNIKINKKLLIE